MDFEEAIKSLDATVFAKKKFHLKDVEVLILRGAWQGKKYYEIAEASGYTPTYLQQDIGPKLWKLISEVLGEKVSKTNFQAALQRHWLASVESATSDREYSAVARQGISSQDGEISAFNSEEELNIYSKFNFVGREKAIADINNIFKQGAKIILVQGEGGIGKSLLSWEYLTSQGFDVILELWMAKETANITDAKSVVEEWLKRHFHEEATGDFSFGLEKLRQKLREQTKKVGAMIDNLEPALDKDGKLIPPHRDYVELLRVLANPSGNCVTLITSRERLGESAVSFHDYRLEGLDLEAWQQFFSNRQIKTDSPALNAMHQAYGGNAKAMHILSGAIQMDWEGDIDAYWQANEKNLLIERDLEDLIVSQFNRLQELDPEAYKLLCRLGCYRYQDVRSIFLDGVLHLLWDVPEGQRRRIVKSLRDRSLVDLYKGEYWLHSVTKAEAVARLKASEGDQWHTAHRKAAEFWTESVKIIKTVEDGLKALEAYYHYKEIHDFSAACQVFLKERQPNSQTIGQPESLNVSLGRLGLLQHGVSAINSILNNITDDYTLSILYGDLGGNYHRLGDMQNAIYYYRATREKAIKCLESMPEETLDAKTRYEIDRRIKGVGFTIGHCKLNLGESEKAIEAYQETIQLCENTNFHIYAIWSWLGLALVYSDNRWDEYDPQKASMFIEKAYQGYTQMRDKTPDAWWLHIYANLHSGLVYRNLGQNEQALEKLELALSYANQTKNIQNQAQAFNGLAALYRNQSNFEKAIEYHNQAKEILQGIGAKVDLVEVYYQMGLTYQKRGDIKRSKEIFQKAITLYEQIGASKQITKLQKIMENGK